MLYLWSFTLLTSCLAVFITSKLTWVLGLFETPFRLTLTLSLPSSMSPTLLYVDRASRLVCRPHSRLLDFPWTNVTRLALKAAAWTVNQQKKVVWSSPASYQYSSTNPFSKIHFHRPVRLQSEATPATCMKGVKWSGKMYEKNIIWVLKKLGESDGAD